MISSDHYLSHGKSACSYYCTIYGATVKGSAHMHSGRPNQDSIRWINNPKYQVKILSIADGHGGANHFRSNIGSQVATKVSVKVFSNLFRKVDLTHSSIMRLRDIIRYSIPRHIVRKWTEEVTTHLVKNPITDIELKNEFGEYRPELLNIISKNPSMIYGSTSMTIVITNKIIICIQIGDGDIIIVDRARKLVRPFIHDFPSTNKFNISSMNETNSLCMSNSWNKYSVQIFPAEELQPRLILASTDGYSNSFGNMDGFLKIGNDYLDILENKGPVYLKKTLSHILRKTSDNGSGDDITLGYIYQNIP